MKNIFALSLMFIFFVTIEQTTFAQNSKRVHDISFEDYFTQSYIQSCSVSPDGRHVAYVEWRWDKENDGRNRDLWIVNIENKEVNRLTFDKGKETNPQWSPDGRIIYFIGHFKHEGTEKPPYDGNSQIWRINVDGSRLTPITQVPKGIDKYQLSEKGDVVYYTIEKDHTIEDWKELRNEFKDDVDYGHGIHSISELWRLDLTTWRNEKVFDEKYFITDFKVSPDGQRIAIISAPDDLEISNEGKTKVTIYDNVTKISETLDDTEWREQAPSSYGWIENPSWSTDGKLLAFSVDYDGYPTEVYWVHFEKNKPKTNKMLIPDNVSLETDGSLQWLPDEEVICFLGDRLARQHIYAIDIVTNTSKMLTSGNFVIDKFDFINNSSSLVALQSELTYHHDLVLHPKQGKPIRLTQVNPQVDTWKLPQISIVQWEGSNGDLVEGILELPHDYNKSKKLPLIVEIHGGPNSSEKLEFKFWIYGRTAFAAKGYAVLSPNYRGSTGYGTGFLMDLIGHKNDIDVEDILKGVEAMIERGIADPERLGVMGWSNGGYLTNCLIATNRFKAASSGAGVFDTTIQWSEEDTPGHVINYSGGFPWEKPKTYQSTSPLYSFKPGITTATLIHVGEHDARVPATHSQALHRALHYYIHAPCELLIYKGAEHNLTKYRHRLAKLKWDHEWFNKYLPVGETKPEQATLKEK